MHSQPRHPRRSKWGIACVVAYWFLLFTSTHWPNPWADEQKVPQADKAMHGCAYAILGLLVGLVIAHTPAMNAAMERRIVLRRYLRFWLIIAVYGFFDEATQPLVRRDFEWLDWVADMVGGACGILIAIVLRGLWSKIR